MQKEDKVNADLGQAKHDQSERRTGGHSRSVCANKRGGRGPVLFGREPGGPMDLGGGEAGLETAANRIV